MLKHIIKYANHKIANNKWWRSSPLLGYVSRPLPMRRPILLSLQKTYIHEFWKYFSVMLVKHRDKSYHYVPLEILRITSIKSTPFSWDLLWNALWETIILCMYISYRLYLLFLIPTSRNMKNLRSPMPCGFEMGVL